VPTLRAPVNQTETGDRRVVRDNWLSRSVLWDRSVTFILIVGICISVVSFGVVRSQEVQSARDEFHLAAATSEYAVRQQIESNIATLRAVRAYVQATADPPSEDFDRFTRQLIRNNPAILSLRWVPRGGKLPAVGPARDRFEITLNLPVFEDEPEHERLRGYALGVFEMAAILENGLRGLKPEPIDIEFYDLSAALGKQFLYQHQWAGGTTLPRYKSESEALKEDDFKSIMRFDAGGREWAMIMTATDSYRQARLTWLSWNIVATFLVITAISAAHFLMHVARARTDEERLHLQLRKAAEDALRISEERYALAARGSKDGLWDWDLQAGLVFYSERWKSMLGFEGKAIGNSPNEWIGRLYPADRARVELEIAQHCAGETNHFQSEYRILHNDGSYRWMLSRGVAVVNDYGVATRLAGSQTDITESKAADPLTGLASRLLVDEKLQFAIDAMRSNPNARFAVLFLDLDRFKVVNDSLGHLAGDQLLLRIAERLLACVAEPPFAALQTLVARLGGDEFVVLICGMNHAEIAMALANRIHERMTPAFNLDGHHLFVSTSIGVRLGQSDATPETLLLDADTAMYHAKARGKQRYEVFVPAMRLQAVERLRLETDLRAAIQRDELVVYYQPKVCLATGRVVEVEALVRWMHPLRGLVGPVDFIPLAEETGLILQLGECVLRKACRQMTIWLSDFDLDPEMRVSVNLSCRQFRQPHLFDRIMGILAETGLSPDRLSLEVTEGVLMDNVDNALVLMNRLRGQNIGLQLDDFGTGYSSLSYLRRLPFDGLKIDKSFVQETGLRQENAEIVGTVALLARTLGMKVLAEGVETLDQLQMLIGAGCDYAQGNLFSAPVTSDVTSALFSGFRHIISHITQTMRKAKFASPVLAKPPAMAFRRGMRP
jgi:diguanylate cyclase (GGDEF)-like protein/PAS domain S-box-containing protein